MHKLGQLDIYDIQCTCKKVKISEGGAALHRTFNGWLTQLRSLRNIYWLAYPIGVFTLDIYCMAYQVGVFTGHLLDDLPSWGLYMGHLMAGLIIQSGSLLYTGHLLDSLPRQLGSLHGTFTASQTPSFSSCPGAHLMQVELLLQVRQVGMHAGMLQNIRSFSYIS